MFVVNVHKCKGFTKGKIKIYYRLCAVHHGISSVLHCKCRFYQEVTSCSGSMHIKNFLPHIPQPAFSTLRIFHTPHSALLTFHQSKKVKTRNMELILTEQSCDLRAPQAIYYSTYQVDITSVTAAKEGLPQCLSSSQNERQ